jgi:hypothetical protein
MFTKSLQFTENLLKVYNLFKIGRPRPLSEFTESLQFVHNSGTQGVHNSFTIWSRKVYKLFTISLKRVAAWESDTMKNRGVSVSPAEFFFDLSTQLSQRGGWVSGFFWRELENCFSHEHTVMKSFFRFKNHFSVSEINKGKTFVFPLSLLPH